MTDSQGIFISNVGKRQNPLYRTYRSAMRRAVRYFWPPQYRDYVQAGGSMDRMLVIGYTESPTQGVIHPGVFCSLDDLERHAEAIYLAGVARGRWQRRNHLRKLADWLVATYG